MRATLTEDSIDLGANDIMRNASSLRACSLGCAVLLAAACGGQPLLRSQSPSVRGTAAGDEWVPPPDARISTKAWRLARAINKNELALVRDLKKWRKRGAHLEGGLVPEIKRRALYQQRITARLAQHPGLYKRVHPRLNGKARSFYRANVMASRTLASLGSGKPPKDPPDFRYRRPEAPNDLWRYYSKGFRWFEVPRNILAAVNFVETKFGRVLGPSSAGARGPMQFLPSTWDAYGGGGNIWNPHDSILAAGRYLRASGAPKRMRDALYAYNPSDAYVEVILIYARQISRRRFRYLNYFWWQVFVRTRDGTIQMTGPGTSRPRY